MPLSVTFVSRWWKKCRGERIYRTLTYTLWSLLVKFVQLKHFFQIFLTWIDLQKLIWMNFKATFLTLPVKMHTFFWILIFFSVLSCLSWLTNWVFSITAEKVTQNWSLSLLISQPLLFNKYFYCKTGIYPPDRVSDNSAGGTPWKAKVQTTLTDTACQLIGSNVKLPRFYPLLF